MSHPSKNDDVVLNDFSQGDEESQQREPFIEDSGSKPESSAPPAALTSFKDNPIVSVLSYCAASISMTIVNKFVVSGASWNLTFLYLAIQSAICVFTIVACKQLGVITSLAAFDYQAAKKWSHISVLLVAMIYTGNKALQYLSVPVYTIFKNLAIIIIAYGEVQWFGATVSKMANLSFGLMLLSSVVAAWADWQSATHAGKDGDANAPDVDTLNAGYFWMMLNVFANALYVLRMRKVIKTMNFSDWDTMFYNNLLTVPLSIICSVLVEDWSKENFAANFPADARYRLLSGILYSGVAAIFISYCTAWCIRVTSSTTYAMVGALNKLPIAVFGLIFFSAPVTVGSVTAIAMGFGSGILYTKSKLDEKKQKESLGNSSKP